MRHVLYLAILAAAPAFSSRGADVREGLVSYWPFETISADLFTTPDLVTGNDMMLSLLDSNYQVDGPRGKAFQLDGVSQFLWFMNPPEVDTGLPISKAPAFTVMFWANGVGTGQNDRRMFSESSSLSTDPLFNLGTHNGGADGTVDIYIRNEGVRINHAHSTNAALDGEWHHIAWTDNNGEAALYIDGELDSTHSYTRGNASIDTTSIGAIVREGGFNIGALFAGALDEVAVWERILTPAEIQDVMENGIETPVPAFPPTFEVQPQGDTELLVGRSATLQARAIGSRPLTFQWQKDGVPIEGATGLTLVLENLELDDSGDYTLVAENAAGTVTSEPAEVVVSPLPPPDLDEGLVAYWPLDEIQGTITPDVVSGYDMIVNNLTEANIVTGQAGNAFQFSFDQSTLLSRIHTEGEDLPINQHPAFTISMWSMVDGLGQNDLRLFSEANTGDSGPLFNIGTHNGGAGPEADFYMRQAAVGDQPAWITVDHLKSVGTPFDGTWHHIVLVQHEDGSREFFIDGARDPVEIPAKPPGVFLNADNTTIGGILRTAPSHFVTGLIDEVALWKRALNPNEVALVMTEGVPADSGFIQPLAIRNFTADYPAVAQGGDVTLRWEVNRDATVTLEGEGDVTSNTVGGIGSITLPVTEDTTFRLTITRDDESVSSEVSVRAVAGVAAGWDILDTFETYSAGQLADKGGWANPEGVVNVVDLGANNVVGVDGGTDFAALSLNSLEVEQGDRTTLFFRFYAVPEDTSVVALNVGLTEKATRGSGDFSGDNVGPYLHLERFEGESSLYAGVNTAGFFDLYPGGVFEAGQVYNVWIDVQNEPVEGYDIYSVYLAEEGQPRMVLFQDYFSNRYPEGTPDLGRPFPDLLSVFISAPGAQGVNSVLLDDFFLSASSEYNDSVPVPASSFIQSEEPSEVTISSFSHDPAASSFTLAWGSEAGQTYDVLKAGSISGPWNAIATGHPAGGATGATTSFTDTSATEGAAFYQISAQ